MIYRILECREDHTKQLTEQGDSVPSDGQDERQLSWHCNQSTPLESFYQQNLEFMLDQYLKAAT
jgi:hypothetical protein